MSSVHELMQIGVTAIIRPPRREYDFEGIPMSFDSSNGQRFFRHPITIENQRKQKIVGSVYIESHFDLLSGLPCLIYMHGNASSQLEGQFLVPNVCPHGVAVYLFDFAGCGYSDGEYISLGHFETADLNFLIGELSTQFGMTQFILWGRSMGAATAVLSRNPRVIGIIVDSAYTSIQSVCKAIAINHGIPRFLSRLSLWFVAMCVWDIAGFDLREVRPKAIAMMDGNPPLVMGHSRNDEFVPFRLGEKLFRSYSAKDKVFVELEDGHNGVRPVRWFRICYRFIFEKFGIDAGAFHLTQFCGFEVNSAHFASASKMLDDIREALAGAQGGSFMKVRICSDDEDGDGQSNGIEV
jgi:pimeloyl-ACP methyl ester carboxylesterase